MRDVGAGYEGGFPAYLLSTYPSYQKFGVGEILLWSCRCRCKYKVVSPGSLHCLVQGRAGQLLVILNDAIIG